MATSANWRKPSTGESQRECVKVFLFQAEGPPFRWPLKEAWIRVMSAFVAWEGGEKLWWLPRNSPDFLQSQMPGLCGPLVRERPQSWGPRLTAGQDSRQSLEKPEPCSDSSSPPSPQKLGWEVKNRGTTGWTGLHMTKWELSQIRPQTSPCRKPRASRAGHIHIKNPQSPLSPQSGVPHSSTSSTFQKPRCYPHYLPLHTT